MTAYSCLNLSELNESGDPYEDSVVFRVNDSRREGTFRGTFNSIKGTLWGIVVNRR